MNKTNFAVNEADNCKGRCILEMQKTLDPQVIAEFLETTRDFYNDDETLSEIKNIIISETNEIGELLNKKAADLCSFIDEVFLHRRQRQSSFYKLCHKLARKATSEGAYLPDESKCICFSQENLRKYNVDSAAASKMKLVLNLEDVKETVEQICGKLLCTKCKRSSTFGSAKYAMIPDCNCTVPTFSSQHKIHEAILDICMNKDPKFHGDSWYLTHLKRDADYYRQKASMSSDNSVDSFEIISPDDTHLDNIDPDLEDLNSAKGKFIIGPQAAAELKLSGSIENVCSYVSSSTDSVVSCSAFEPKDLLKCGKLEDCAVKKLKTESFVENVNKSMPSDIVKQSFRKYLNDNDNSRFIKSSSFDNSFLKAKVPSTASEACNHRIGLEKPNAIKTSTNHPLKGYISDEASIYHPLKSHPSDALKNAFTSYFNELGTNKWLIK